MVVPKKHFPGTAMRKSIFSRKSYIDGANFKNSSNLLVKSTFFSENKEK